MQSSGFASEFEVGGLELKPKPSTLYSRPHMAELNDYRLGSMKFGVLEWKFSAA